MYGFNRQPIANITERIPRPVLDVGNLWNSCLQKFNIIDVGENHDDDYAILLMKLEFEMIRLFFWGESVCLADLGDVVYSGCPALEQEEVRIAAMHLLGRLRGVFEMLDTLERDYGLRQVSKSALGSHLQSVSLREVGSPTSPIFKRVYSKTISLAADHDQQTTTDKAMKWMIVDKKKFQGMIIKIKGLINNLNSLEGYLMQQTMQEIYNGINETRDIKVLKFLQAATTSDYEEVSENVNIRLKELEMPSDSHGENQDERNIADKAKFGEELDELTSRVKLNNLSVNEKATAEQGTADGSNLRTSDKVDTMPARLCYTCENTIMIDDGQLGSVARNQDGSEKFEYTKIDTKKAWSRPGGRSKVIDELPDLPRLRAKGDGPFGCGFCRFLRRSILENCTNEETVRQRLEIELNYVFQGSSTPGPFALEAVLSPESVLYPPKLMFPLVTNAGDCAEWLGLESPIRDALDSKSVETLQNAVTQSQPTFKSTHRADNRFLPTRLIEIAPAATTSKTPSLRLVLKEDLDQKAALDEEIQYAALSYCWGSILEAATQAVTKKDTLRQRRNAIPEEELTPVIVDAINVCRALNIRYLWVDALCIIQDSVSDWEAEAPKMAHVYGEAYLTICPVASTSCQEGFLNRGHTNYVEIQFESILRPRVKGSYKLCRAIPVHADMELLNPYQAQGALTYSRWNTRGWTFQEFLFSSQLLCFGSLRSYFITSEKVITELGWKETLQGALDVPLWNEIVESFEKKDDNFKAYEMWMDVVAGYTGRQLTYPKDILPALSGTAQAFSQGLEDEYKAGLWNKALPQQLLWTVNSGHGQSLESLLGFLSGRDRCFNPSWSWSSRSGHTSYSLFRIGYFKFGKWFVPETASLEARMVVKGGNPFGLVSSGELLITSRFKRVESRIMQKVHKYGESWDVFLMNDVRLDLNFDCVINNADLDAREILLVLVGSVGQPFDEEECRSLDSATLAKVRRILENSREAHGLIICPCPNTSQRDVWFRIGTFNCRGSPDINGWGELARDAVMKTVIIV